jgi:hypothetical protein
MLFIPLFPILTPLLLKYFPAPYYYPILTPMHLRIDVTYKKKLFFLLSLFFLFILFFLCAVLFFSIFKFLDRIYFKPCVSPPVFNHFNSHDLLSKIANQLLYEFVFSLCCVQYCVKSPFFPKHISCNILVCGIRYATNKPYLVVVTYRISLCDPLPCPSGHGSVNNFLEINVLKRKKYDISGMRANFIFAVK